MRPCRREVLLGLGAVALLPSCMRTAPVEPAPDVLRLGWRWVPGAELSYETRTTHRRPGAVTTRVERWTYLVTARDQGIATLEGHLVGLGGDETEGDAESRLEAERTQGGRAQLRLGVDGRLRPRASTACPTVGEPSAACFGPQLSHRLLALPLPSDPVRRGREWSDPGLVAMFSPLITERAAALEQARGSCSLFDIHRSSAGMLRVDLRSTGLLRGRSGLVLRVGGQATWDPAGGYLQRRTLHARLGGAGNELEVRLTRVG